MSDLQRDIEQVEWVMGSRTGDEPWAAWQRLRARLEAVPDEDAVADAVQKEAAGWAAPLCESEARQVAIAAIAAIKGDTK